MLLDLPVALDPAPERRAGLNARIIEPLAWLCRRDLIKLAMLSGTDKWGAHWYAAHYARHFQHLRRKQITLLEIGIGGYDDPKAGGGSLRMWRRYFPNAQIVGLYADHSAALIAIGGSGDFNRSKNWAIRLSPDLILEHFGNETREFFAISGGVVYRFPVKKK